MEKERLYFQIKKIVLFMLMAAGLGMVIYFLIEEYKGGQQINPAEQQVSQYESEIADIEDRLNLMKDDIWKTSSVAQVALLFCAGTEREFAAIDTVMNDSAYTPTVLLDAAMERGEMTPLLKKIQEKNWDVVFFGKDLNAGTMEKAKKAKKLAAQYNVKVTDLFYGEKEKYTDSNILVAKNAGFAGFSQLTDYGNEIVSGYSINSEMIYIEHVPVSDFSKKISGSVRLICTNKKELLFTISMRDYLEGKQGKVNQDSIDQLFDLLGRCQAEEQLKVVPAYEIVDKLVQNLQISLQRKKEYDEYSAKQEVHIQELEKKKEEVYKKYQENGEYHE